MILKYVRNSWKLGIFSLLKNRRREGWGISEYMATYYFNGSLNKMNVELFFFVILSLNPFLPNVSF